MDANTNLKTQETLSKDKPIITGAEAVLKCFLEEGVNTIFGYPGGAIMPVYDALYHYQKELKHILPRHEQGALSNAALFVRVSCAGLAEGTDRRERAG